MRPRRPSPEHEQAVSRRLAALSAQWDAARAEESGQAPPSAAVVPDEEWPWEPHTRVRDAVVAPVQVEGDGSHDLATTSGPVPVPPAGEVPRPLEVPVPGRHAARRPSGLLRLPDLPTDRVTLRPAHLVWVGLVAATALALGAWWVVQARDVAVVTPVAAPVAAPASEGQPSPPEGVATPPSPGAAATGGQTVGPSAGASGEVVVDVAGKVRRPGIVVLPVGSRVHDALEAAGGARRGVDLRSLNLARVLVDGEQILVGVPAAAPVAGTAGSSGPPAAGGVTPGGLVNLNSATTTDLETLPGVGPVTAAAIVEWRTRHGGFTSVEDLLEVDGIGEVTLERLAPLVTV